MPSRSRRGIDQSLLNGPFRHAVRAPVWIPATIVVEGRRRATPSPQAASHAECAGYE